jgi:hypothetical protein
VIKAAKKRLTAVKDDGDVMLLMALAMFADTLRSAPSCGRRHVDRLLAPATIAPIIDITVGAIEIAPTGYLPDKTVNRKRRSINYLVREIPMVIFDHRFFPALS